MTDHEDIHADPIEVQRFGDKHGRDLDDEGPPVAQMASTYGSSFVSDAEQAERIADGATPEPDERDVSAEDHEGPTPPG